MSWEVRAEVVQVEVAPAIWKANRFWVLVADWVLYKVKGIPWEVEAKLTVMVVVARETEEEAWRLPAIWRVLEIVEEPAEIIPVRLESPLTARVLATVREEEASNGPAKWKAPAKEEEAEEIKPDKLESPLTAKVPEIVAEEEACKAPANWSGPAIVEEPTEIKAPPKEASPETVSVEEAESGPATFKELAMVEEDWAKKPPETFKAKTVVEAASWTSKAFLVWPVRVRSARLMEPVEVAPMVRTELAETLEVPTTN